MIAMRYTAEWPEDEPDPKPDMVNHPPHYTAAHIEVFDFIEAWGLTFAEGAVIKYLVRAPLKQDEVEDLKKAKWYLDKLIAKAERNERG